MYVFIGQFGVVGYNLKKEVLFGEKKIVNKNSYFLFDIDQLSAYTEMLFTEHLHAKILKNIWQPDQCDHYRRKFFQ